MDSLIILVVIIGVIWVVNTSSKQALQEGAGLVFLFNKEKYLHAKMASSSWRSYYLIANFLFFVGAIGVILLAFVLMSRLQLSGTGWFIGIALALAIVFSATAQFIVEGLLKRMISRETRNP
ncbi:MAG: hypothetical protein WD751_07160 [Anaerolineales bacterium]